MEEIKIYRCGVCGEIVVEVKGNSKSLTCCGKLMTELVPNTIDASFEKHVPVITKTKNVVTVEIGEIDHPMTEDHYIEWVLLLTNNGFKIKYLKPNCSPFTTFVLSNDEIVKRVYCYCNLHGLWVK